MTFDRLDGYTMTSPSGRLYIPLAYQMTLNLTQGGQVCAVVLGGIERNPGTFPVLADLTTWRDKAWAMVRGLASSSVTCTGAVIRSTSSATGTVTELGPPSTPTGAGTPPDAVAAASVLLKWKTAQGGRSGKGRTFVPGLPQSNVGTDGRTLTAGAVTNANNMITAYLVGTGAVQPAVLSFTKGQAYAITSGAPAGVIGIQRRRMR